MGEIAGTVQKLRPSQPLLRRVPKEQIIFTDDGETELNYLCEGYRSFFSHTSKAMKFMANELINHRPASNIMKISG